MTNQRNRPERKPLIFGPYYDLVAGLLYLFLSYFLYRNPMQGINPDIIKWVMIIFCMYGIFRLGRAIFSLLKK